MVEKEIVSDFALAGTYIILGTALRATNFVLTRKTMAKVPKCSAAN
jgi:hypothetical protein